MDKKNNADKFADLRQRAETLLQTPPTTPDKVSIEEFLHVLHELEVHQVELEMQNEDLRVTQLELDTSRRKYVDLYDFAPVGYLTLSETGLILEINLTGATLLGIERSQLIKQPFSRFVFAEDQDAYYLHRKRLFETSQPQSFELRLITPDGTLFYAQVEGATVGDGESLSRIAISDITERKQARKRAAALAVAQEKVEILRMFLNNAAHHLRTSLTVLISSLYLLEHEEVLTHQKPRIITLKTETNHLARLLDNLLELLDISESGNFTFGYLDLNSLVNTIIDEQMQLVGQRGISCTFHPDSNLSPIWADKIHLKSAIAHVIDNSLTYTLESGEVRVSTEVQGTNAAICVKDNGIGIGSVDLPHIFERFFRTDLAINRNQHGTGLGLSIVERVVTEHHGKIEVESEPDKGSTFTINLPLRGPST